MSSERALVIGGFGVDVNVALPDGVWPTPDADTVFVSIGDLSVGHAGSGVALQAAALRADVVGVDLIGDDAHGRFVTRELTARGVDLRTELTGAGTRRSVNLVRPDGGRTSLHDPRHPYDAAPDPALWRAAMADAGWVHAVIVNWARAVLPEARARGIVTSTDLQDWDLVNPHHRDFALGADYVFCSAANLPSDRALVDLVLSEGVGHTVVVSRGADGALVYRRDVADPLHVPAVVLPGHRIVDTNGAGDAFCGTFMTATLRGDGPAEAGRKAAIAASYACSFAGTNDHLMSAEQLAREA